MADYSNILNNLNNSQRGFNDHIMLVDGMNTLIRSFSLIKSLNPDGTHVGGMIGFLRSIGYLNRIIDPTRIIVIWDGKGGSGNRQNLNPDYKAQRANARITHWGLYDSKEEETEALVGQIYRTQEYLMTLPIHQICLDKLEADDIIAYLAKVGSSSNKKVTIVSSDKDFLQLVDDNVQVYAPIKKKIIDNTNIVDEIKVLPQNYNVVKALLGDNSDNLQGVKGLGIKTLVSEWKELTTDKVTLQDIYDKCDQQLETKKIFAKILYNWDKVETNFKIMDLHNSVLSEKEQEMVSDIIKSPLPNLQTGAFLRLLEQDRVEGITKNTSLWLEGFTSLTINK